MSTPPENRFQGRAPYAPPMAPGRNDRTAVATYGGQVDDAWSTQAIMRMPQPDPEARSRTARTIVIWVIVGLLVLLMGITLLVVGVQLIALQVPAREGLLAVLLSAVPLTWITAVIVWFDRWKPQPIPFIVAAVLWGAAVAVLATFLLSFIADRVVATTVGVPFTADPILAPVVSAPIIEEFTKGLFLVVLVLGFRKYFEGPLDGWMYGTLAGAGFAFTENILYLGRASTEGLAALGMLFVLRGVLSPLIHSAFTAAAGMSIGLAARRGAWWTALIMWIPGLCVGMLLHGMWNGVSTIVSARVPQQGTLGLVVTIGVVVVMSAVLSCAWFTVGLVLRHQEAKHTRTMLTDYAKAGWMTPREVQMLGTWKGRRAGRRWAKKYPGAKKEMARLVRMGAHLAGVRERVVSGIGGDKEKETETYLLEKFTRQRKLLQHRVNTAGAAGHGSGGPGSGGPRSAPPRVPVQAGFTPPDRWSR
ncbi:PrsW family intramembrane metalloprotease [Brevibacterium litoralis]|uniref:PrsW family intramembrane metalloprotease n=1 Tax=Brevibacterium litoralis TaxID=3138935 RepID=UPI0032EE7DD6